MSLETLLLVLLLHVIQLDPVVALFKLLVLVLDLDPLGQTSVRYVVLSTRKPNGRVILEFVNILLIVPSKGVNDLLGLEIELILHVCRDVGEIG